MLFALGGRKFFNKSVDFKKRKNQLSGKNLEWMT